MRTFFTGLFLVTVLALSAQKNDCATHMYTRALQASGAEQSLRLRSAEAFVQQKLNPNPLQQLTTYTGSEVQERLIRIPVVVHILYNNEAQNLSEERVRIQIEALNRDFRRRNADTGKTPERFRPFAADVEIEFVLATADPKGRPTNGILRKYTARTFFDLDDKIKFSAQGGDDAWDPLSYLNIWVGNTRRTLGYASPVGTERARDGIVLNTSVFGLNNGSATGKSRTGVHEAGHWLGLKHIWGDEDCGDDGVSDTPPQSTFNTGCPSGIKITCGNGPLGDMYMNYMDFTDDGCMNLFTNGQKDRMRAHFSPGGFRHALLSSRGLDVPWTEEAPEEEGSPSAPVALYPNPADAEVFVDLKSDGWGGSELRIVGLNGVEVRRIKVTAVVQKISLTGLPAGLYVVQGTNGKERISLKLVKQ
ncbi:MAG TPA: M43 family zinc metalloprotease [Chitinophagaceae bacterium]|jgi:hypothetical protein|nr:M43 family zinc metalloprotease [Chitinophagaceae bacterium]